MFKFINCLVNYSIVLLLGVVSLMAGSTNGVPMFPCYGGYQTKTPPPYYATTSYYTEAPKYCTTKAREFYTTTCAAPSYYTDSPKYYSALSYYTTKAPEYYMTTYAAPSYYASAPKYQLLHRGSSLLLHQNGRILHRSAKVLLCPDLHNRN
jgi:hypothetical protein